MHAVPEPALRGQAIDIGKSREQTLLGVPQCQCTHAGSVDEHARLGHEDEFPRDGRVPTLAVGGAHLRGLLRFPAILVKILRHQVAYEMQSKPPSRSGECGHPCHKFPIKIYCPLTDRRLDIE